jgi:formylglycine-generating enzyme required for sulfatase activity
VRDKKSDIELLLIPPGTYVRGAETEDPDAYPSERPAHEVTITRAFYLGRFDVTNAQFRKFRSKHDSSFPDNKKPNGPSHPVIRVSWDDAVAFLDSYGLRLPSEGEWEYAARAGRTGPRYGALDAIAWYAEDSETTSHPVGQKAGNAFGLHDMLGNVYQWCADWYAEDAYALVSAGVTDPQGPVSGTVRVARGGSWIGNPSLIRASHRWYGPSLLSGQVIGFRAARTP